MSPWNVPWRSLTALVVALAIASVAGSARAQICVVVDPVLDLCGGEGTPRRSQPEQASPAPAQQATIASAPAPDAVRHTSTDLRYHARQLAVTFRPRTSRETIRNVIARAGATVEYAIPQIRAYVLDVDPDRRAEALASLRESAAVASAAREQLAEAFDLDPDDRDWPQQHGLRVAGFPKAWEVTQGSSGVVVAVIDSGVDAQHVDLRGALVPGHDFVNGDADPADDHGHGTAVAGVIAARANSEGGAGVCPRCSLMPIKVLDASGTGGDTAIAAGIVWAADHGAKVVNLSLGGPGSSPELTNAIGYAVAKGVILVAAAGNSGTTTQFFPAADSRAVSVAATTTSDARYSWSNFGPWVRLAAPGCNIATLPGGRYGNFCGTSSATPLVAGLVALELSAHPRATAQEVERALVSAAVPLPDVVQFGRIDAGKTLSLLKPAAARSASAVFRGRVSRAYTLNVGAGPLTATLQFTGSRRLVLTILPAGTRAAGRSPLRLTTVADPGRITLRVGGARKTRFVLRVSYVLRDEAR
jgi:subtilisin family serine protease